MPGADDLVELFYAAYNAHNAAAAATLYVEDGWHEEVNAGRRRHGRDAIAEGLDRLFAMMPDVAWQPGTRIRAGSSMLVLYTMTARLTADIGPFRGRGQVITLTGAHAFELTAGGLAGTRDYWDMADFARQAA